MIGDKVILYLSDFLRVWVELQLFVDPVALLFIGVMSPVLYVSRKVVALQPKEGTLMNLRLLLASLF
ncbi:hypothetical protein AMS62_23225 [Bacillus sp. FJAT-18019]|nr:hypothetical protein AMS62_23225 [Bacillus sp. FJAT-18019]